MRRCRASRRTNARWTTSPSSCASARPGPWSSSTSWAAGRPPTRAPPSAPRLSRSCCSKGCPASSPRTCTKSSCCCGPSGRSPATASRSGAWAPTPSTPSRRGPILSCSGASAQIPWPSRRRAAPECRPTSARARGPSRCVRAATASSAPPRAPPTSPPRAALPPRTNTPRTSTPRTSPCGRRRPRLPWRQATSPPPSRPCSARTRATAGPSSASSPAACRRRRSRRSRASTRWSSTRVRAFTSERPTASASGCASTARSGPAPWRLRCHSKTSPTRGA
mmetsp:Transcript_31886/g.110229  ORF Transcript_31886/g.110229 Transcript_31886/m.110229 type:complete len:279 (+) Transcript_31886:2490-3326(+)